MSKQSETESIQIFLREIAKVRRLDAEEEIILGRQVFWMIAIRDIRLAITPEGGKCDETEVCKILNRDHQQRILKLNKTLFELKDLRKLERIGLLARDRMVEANLRLVISIAKRYCDSTQGLLDLTQEGVLGLHRGVEKYDPERGYRLSTYVTWWIRQAISRAINDKSRSVRLSVAFAIKLRKIKRCETEMLQCLGGHPSQQALIDELIARGLVRNEIDYQQMILRSQDTLSLDQSVGSEQDVFAIVDKIAAPGSDELPDALGLIPLRTDLNILLATLSQVERTVIQMRFGLGAHGIPRSYDEIDAELGYRFGTNKLRKIAESAMRSLKKPQNRKFLAKHR
jgi:RNA polymerase sigma factor (sigma-70 family)